jgi:crotonobetainyl-CoA:carnitine CoA-transferase CaiB-like acyl-CoA transferase
LSPLLGEHGEAVLLEAGIALAQVQELVDAQVAAGGRPLP